MKEHPILFSGPMVRATLEGRKTMTRRVIKPQPWEVMPSRVGNPKWPYGFKYYPGSNSEGEPFPMKCPHGQPGDRLWVRETFQLDCDERLYKADMKEWEALGINWRPSIFMPRNLSRLTLEVVSVRVERLNEMIDASESSVLSEGVEPSISPNPETRREIAISRFRELWDSINLKRGYGWYENPWVWVVEFKRV